MTIKSDQEVRELLSIRAELAGLNVLLKLERLRLALKRFNHSQPRVPAGNPDGGQWTDRDENTGFDAEAGTLRPLLVSDRSNVDRYKIDLREDEGRGGHSITAHVEKSDTELKNGVKPIIYNSFFTAGRLRYGTFYSL